MDAPCKIQGSIHVFRLVNNMCPGKWVHIIKREELFLFVFMVCRFLLHFPSPGVGGCHPAVFVQSVPCRVGNVRHNRFRKSPADDVCRINDEKKGVGIDGFYMMTELCDFPQIDNGENDFFILSAESTLSV